MAWLFQLLLIIYDPSPSPSHAHSLRALPDAGAGAAGEQAADHDGDSRPAAFGGGGSSWLPQQARTLAQACRQGWCYAAVN